MPPTHITVNAGGRSLLPYVWLAVAALMFGLYNVFIKLSSEHIQPVLGAVVLQFVAAFLGTGLLIYMHRTGTVLHSSTRGIWLAVAAGVAIGVRSEEHTSELQSRGHLVCRLLLEKK